MIQTKASSTNAPKGSRTQQINNETENTTLQSNTPLN